jgi:thioredoxin reductase
MDDQGYAGVDTHLETGLPGIILAGDIRAGAPRTAAAVQDGALAAATALRLLGPI